MNAFAVIALWGVMNAMWQAVGAQNWGYAVWETSLQAIAILTYVMWCGLGRRKAEGE